jgi:hypothetical protein
MGNPIKYSSQAGLISPPQMCLSWGTWLLCSGEYPVPLFQSQACGVGNNESPVTEVRGTKCDCRKAIPFCIVPACGQVSENVSNSTGKQAWNVFHKNKLWSYHANDPHKLGPEPSFVRLSHSSADETDGLTGKPPAEQVAVGEISSPNLGDVAIFRYSRPVFV